MNLGAALEDRAVARGWGSRPALVDGRRTLDHGEVHDGAARAAALLAELGVARGDRVLLSLPDGAELAWAFLGAVRLGALAVVVNPQLPAGDHRRLAEDCQAAVVVGADDQADHFGGHPFVGGGRLGSSLSAYRPHPAVAMAAGEAAYAQYTSGTTGVPRAAVHRHGDPLVYAEAFADRGLRLGEDDVVLSVSKMHFAYGLGNSLFFPLLSGACAVVHPGRPRPEDITALLGRHHVTVLFAVPTFYANLLRSPPEGRPPSLRVAVSAGERLSTTLAQRTADLLGCPVLDSLGSTEVGQAFVGTTLDANRAGTIGRALPPYEVAVRTEAGAALPPGTIGALWVRGPTLLLEYLGQPEATAAAFDGEWLRTGDLASLDDDGFLTHHGRADDLEDVGGITVAPQEIEELLSRHPAVSEVAVAAVTDDDGGSRLRAFVVLLPGAAADDRLEAALTDLARAHLAAYKVPRSVTFVGALPRTPTGKLRRFVLRSDPTWAASGTAG